MFQRLWQICNRLEAMQSLWIKLSESAEIKDVTNPLAKTQPVL